MRRLIVSLSGVAIILGSLAAPLASAQQSVSFYIGGFTPRALDARPDDDVLVANGTFLATENQLKGIDIGEFNNVTVGGEWLFPMTRYVEGGLGLGFYQKSVPTVDTDFEHPNGTDIRQTLKLRIVPFAATIRFLPLGNNHPIQPYIGAGVGVYSWRYSETGEFVYPDGSIRNRNFVATGADTGPTILGGVRVPIGPTRVGFEIRHQSAEGTVPGDDLFTEGKIDLGGYNYLFTVSYKF